MNKKSADETHTCSGIYRIAILQNIEKLQNYKSIKMELKDTHGTPLQTGDTVQIIKDLKVGGSSMTLKQGTVIKNIRIIEGEDEVHCRIGKSTIMLRPEFLKKR